MNGAVIKQPDMCLERDNYLGHSRDNYLGHSRYSVTWCGLKYPYGSFSIYTTVYEYATCEYCKEEYALGLLADLP